MKNNITLRRAALVTIFAALPFIVQAVDFSVDGIFYNITSTTDLTVEVTSDSVSGSYYSGDIVIPENVTYDGKTYSVTAIGDRAFEGSSTLSSIVIPESVTTIGNRAFSYCTGLRDIVIPDGVIIIDKYAFITAKGC